ncbi:Uncharacterised protein [uncultured archaeon]|nr:Uncharacterised protein [uncultured archaeon]
MTDITILVEGKIDELVLKKILETAGHTMSQSLGKQGKGFVKERIRKYAQAARWIPIIVLVDLDSEQKCAPKLIEEWNVPAHLTFRVAVKEIESWLLADTKNFSAFFSVYTDKIPQKTDELENPKKFLISLCSTSRKREIREGMVPRNEGGREVGAGYSAFMTEYITQFWNPNNAANRSESLKRTIDRIKLKFANTPATG